MQEHRRDAHALFQGAHLLLIGAVGAVGVFVNRRTATEGPDAGLFIGWMIAVGIAWVGVTMIRRGRRKPVYNSVLRWIFTLPLASIWLVVILVGMLLLYARATGSLPGFAMQLLPNSGSIEAIDDVSVAAPAGWKREKNGSFTLGGTGAVVVVYRNNGSIPKVTDERAERVGELLRESTDDDARAAKLTTRHGERIKGLDVWSTSYNERDGDATYAYDSYWIVDDEHDRSWNVLFAHVGRRTPTDTIAEQRFLAALPYQDASLGQ